MISPATLRWCPVSFKLNAWPKKNKFGAKKTVVDGITFDSKREAAYYGQLKMMKAGGLIKSFERQYVCPLYAWSKSGMVKVGKHIVDFVVTLPDGKKELHEVKGVETTTWRLKKKILEANCPGIVYKVIK